MSALGVSWGSGPQGELDPSAHLVHGRWPGRGPRRANGRLPDSSWLSDRCGAQDRDGNDSVGLVHFKIADRPAPTSSIGSREATPS